VVGIVFFIYLFCPWDHSGLPLGLWWFYYINQVSTPLSLIQTPPDSPSSPPIATSLGRAPRIKTIRLPKDDKETDPLYFCPLPGCEDGILVRMSEETEYILWHNEGRRGYIKNKYIEVRGSILRSNAILKLSGG